MTSSARWRPGRGHTVHIRGNTIHTDKRKVARRGRARQGDRLNLLGWGWSSRSKTVEMSNLIARKKKMLVCYISRNLRNVANQCFKNMLNVIFSEIHWLFVNKCYIPHLQKSLPNHRKNRRKTCWPLAFLKKTGKCCKSTFQIYVECQHFKKYVGY